MTTAQSTGALRVDHDASENLVLPEQAEYRADLADRLFACFVALAIVTVYTPLRTLHSLFTWTLIALLPLATLPGSFSACGADLDIPRSVRHRQAPMDAPLDRG